MQYMQALEVLENSLSHTKPKEKEYEVKKALKTLVVEAKEGNKDAKDVLLFIRETANKKATE